MNLHGVSILIFKSAKVRSSHLPYLLNWLDLIYLTADSDYMVIFLFVYFFVLIWCRSLNIYDRFYQVNGNKIITLGFLSPIHHPLKDGHDPIMACGNRKNDNYLLIGGMQRKYFYSQER